MYKYCNQDKAQKNQQETTSRRRNKVRRVEPAATKTSTTNYNKKEGQRSNLTILKHIK